MAVVKIVENSVLDTGDYKVCVTDIGTETGQFGEQVKFVLDVEGTGGKQLFYWCSLTGSTNGKLFKTANAFGMSLEPGSSLDLDDLVGKRAVASVIVKAKDDGSEFNKIESIRPIRAKATAEKKPDPFEDE
ncbi:MAG: hypothetical protein KBC96_15175 [Armatimonadetes bacterium]|nr:hypothetical protein [Armatimonadota bacterium]